MSRPICNMRGKSVWIENLCVIVNKAICRKLCFQIWVIFIPSPSLLKISNSLIKNPIYYNILEFVPKKQCKNQFKRRPLTINYAIQSHLKCPLFQSTNDKPRSKSMTTPSRTPTYHFSRTLSTGSVLEEG